jgi:hypothetical protein
MEPPIKRTLFFVTVIIIGVPELAAGAVPALFEVDLISEVDQETAIMYRFAMIISNPGSEVGAVPGSRLTPGCIESVNVFEGFPSV